MQHAPPGQRKSPLVGIGIVGALVIGALVIGAASSRHGRGASASIAPEPDVAGTVARAAVPTPPDAPMSLADASRMVSIEMYSASWCPSCGRAKAWMHDHDITFHEIDVDQRAGAMAQLQMLNPRRTLPTFDVDGQVLVGFQEPSLRSAIEEGARHAAGERRRVRD